MGVSVAVKELGGILVKNLGEIEVEALPSDLPHSFEVSIERLKTFEDFIRVKDLKISENVKILGHSEEDVMATVQPPRSEEELAALEKPTAEEEKAAIEGMEAEATKEKEAKAEVTEEGKEPEKAKEKEVKAEEKK